MARYVFITGGVVSSLGKGLASAALGAVLQARGYTVRLRKLDPLDAEPSAAWKGTVVHDVLKAWHRAGGGAGELLALASGELAQMQAHPLVRSLWWPRLARGLEWIDQQVARAALDAPQGDAVHVRRVL